MGYICWILLQAVSQLPVSDVEGDQQWARVLLVFAHGDLSLELLPWTKAWREGETNINSLFHIRETAKQPLHCTVPPPSVFKGGIITETSCWFCLSFGTRSPICATCLNVHSLKTVGLLLSLKETLVQELIKAAEDYLKLIFLMWIETTEENFRRGRVELFFFFSPTVFSLRTLDRKEALNDHMMKMATNI